MSKSIQIKFTLNHDDFNQQLQPQVLDNKECNLLEIIDVPLVGKTLELISRDWFKTKILDIKNLVGISFKISEEINDNAENLLHFVKNWNKISFVLAIRSTVGKCENKIYWRFNGREEFYYLNIDEDTTGIVSSFCQEFLINEIKAGKNGLVSDHQHKNKIRLHELCDSNENNLLIQATSKYQLNVVQELLKNDFDADCAIDTAWQIFVDDQSDQQKKDQINEIILCLLKANSAFPDDFDYNKASKEVKEFVNKCESLHKDVDEDKFETLKLKLDADPDLIHFYNRYNESLLGYALKSRKFEIFKLLKKEITTGCHEDLEEIYENMEKKEFKILREQHKENAKEFPETYILVLKSKCKIGNNDRLSHKKWKFIDEAFDFLNSNDYCRKILKVAAEAKKLKIYFDFKHDSTYYMDPATSIYSKGIIYEGGSIFIGAKNLEDDDKKFEVFGVIAHELCHLAVYLAFMNRNFDPFSMGESDNRTRFINRVMKQCKEREESEQIVENVFISYSEDLQDSEMIVTVPQMLMQYAKDPQKIAELEGIFEELFKYSKEIVEPELDRALPVLKILGSEEVKIKFDELTEPMKTKILHSTVMFQGVETTFNDLIGNDENTLKLLKSEKIKGILMKNNKFKLGEVHKSTSKYELSQRSYIKTETFEDICKTDRSHREPDREKKNIESKIRAERKTYEEIKIEVENSKIFLLVDDAGAGKTTSMEDIAIRLKKCCKNSWVCFINLRENVKKFKDIEKDSKLNIFKVFEILLKLVNAQEEIEKRIFAELFLSGKLILFFDGVDEISPKFTKVIKEFLKFLREYCVKNQLWISSRPHYAKELEEYLNCSGYKFAPYENDEKVKFIKNILKIKYKNYDEEKQKELIQEIQDIILFLDMGLKSTQNLNNSLLIKIVTELFAEDVIDSKVKGICAIHDAMFDRQVKKLGKKADDLNKNLKLKFTSFNIYEVLALKVIIEDNYQDMLSFKLDELKIMKKWERFKDKFSCDMIQRLGFVRVDLNNMNHSGSINFIHRTHAEFIVAKYLLDSLFDDNDDDFDEELTRKFEILDVACRHNLGDFFMVCFFIRSYIKKESKDKVFHEKIKSLFGQKIKEIHKEISNNNAIILNSFSQYAAILSIDQYLLKKLWKTGQENNILKEIILKFSDKNYTTVMNYAISSYDEKWHEILSGKKLISDQEIENLYEDENDQSNWYFYQNLVKICDLADNCFTDDEKFNFYKNIDLDRVANTKVRWNIIPRLRKFADGKHFMEECLAEICERIITTESMTFVIEQFEQAKHIDKDSVRLVLSRYILKILHNTYDSDTPGILKVIKKLFLKYFSKEEIQDFLTTNNSNAITDKNIFNIIEGTEHLYYYEFKQFIQDIFGPSNYLKVIQWIEFYCIFSHFEISEKRVYINAFDFMLLIYSNDSKKVRELFRKIFRRKFK